jgi:hypothetical protein
VLKDTTLKNLGRVKFFYRSILSALPAPKGKSLALCSKRDRRIDTSYRSYKSIGVSMYTGERQKMDGTWCFLLGMIAGFIPCFAVLAMIVMAP